jgi:hypothetical protein
MGTHIVYGDVVLQNVMTREFDVRPVKDPSETDIWCWKHTIKVSAIIHRDTSVVSTPLGNINNVTGMGILSVTGGNIRTRTDHPAVQAKELKEKLLTHRKQFLYVVDSYILLEGLPNTDPVFETIKTGGFQGEASVNIKRMDVNNGPKPLDCRITYIGANTFNVEWEVEVCKPCSDDVNSTGILGNRWSCVDDVDETLKTTRIWNGRLRTVGSLSAKTMVHQFRYLCLPPMINGFRRKSMKFAGDAAGCELEYTITDEQIVGDATPSPAVMMYGTHTESVGMTALAGITGTVRLSLDGIPGTPKNKLIELAMSIANHKLGVKQGQGEAHIVQSLSITDWISSTNNRIEISMTVLHNPANVAQAGINAWGASIIGRVGEPLSAITTLGPNYEYARPSGSVGCDLANAMFCYLQSPCDYEHGLTGDNEGEGFADPVKDEDPAYSSQDDATPKPDGEFEQTSAVKGLSPWSGITTGVASGPYEGAKDFPWQYSQVDVIDKTSGGRIALPISGGTSSDPSMALIQLHRPTGTRTLKISAERLGKHPTLPEPTNVVIGSVTMAYLWHNTNIRHGKLSGDGKNWIHAVDAEYCYALPNPWALQIPIGASPDTPPNDNLIALFEGYTAAANWFQK